MAIVAGVTAGNVGLIFAGRSNAIVAANTITKYIIVIEYSGQPTGAAVTVIALVAGRDVSGRFPCSLNTVVTSNATAGYRRVVHEYPSVP